ncbi:MAG: hypothetical protein RL238_1335 [Actinomycetota bacterium]
MTKPRPDLAATSPALPRSMWAVGRTEYGEHDRVAVAEVPVPTIGPEEVLIRVHAASLDRGVWHIMAGKPYMARLVFGLRRPKVHTLGMDVAGVIEAVGDGVEALRIGDEVFGGGTGTFAEFATAKGRCVALKPASVSFDDAAATPVSALTALQGLRDKVRLQPGERVLVIGASGGVGVYAVQIALAMGAHVTGVCSAAKVDLVRSLGAHEVIAHEHGDITDTGQHDVILDIGGARSIRHLRRALTPRGRLLMVGAEGTGDWLGVTRQLRAVALSPFVRQRLIMFVSAVRRADLTVLGEMLEAGTLRPSIDRVVPLGGVADAIRDMQAGQIRGKVVVHPTR